MLLPSDIHGAGARLKEVRVVFDLLGQNALPNLLDRALHRLLLITQLAEVGAFVRLTELGCGNHLAGLKLQLLHIELKKKKRR